MSSQDFILNHITNFFNSIEYTSNYSFNNKQKNLIENTKTDLTEIFESDINITITDASVKHSELLQSLSKIFKININIDKLYNMYIDLTKGEINFFQFLNWLIFIDIILENFHELFANISLNNIMKNKIEIYEIESLSNNNIKLDEMYKNLLNEKDEETRDYICFIIFIFICSFCNKFILIGITSTNLDLLTKNIATYNRFYISNFNYSIILYLEMIIYSNLFINSKGGKEKIIKTNTIIHSRNKALSLNQKNIKSNIISSFSGNNIRNNIYFEKNFELENCYFFDSNIIKCDYNEIVKTIMFQSYLKYYFFFHLSKNNIKLVINITIENPKVILNYSSMDSSTKIFSSVDPKIQNLNFENLNILNKSNLSLIFKNFTFDQIIINILGFNNDDIIKNFIINYDEIISKGKNFYFQEQVQINSSEFSSTITYLFYEWELLHDLLIFYSKKKNNNQIITFRFNTFKCNINKITKDIDLYFNFSTIKEKELFIYFKKTQNFINFIYKVQIILELLQNFKQYNIGIRLLQNNFRSHQLKLYLQLYIKSIIDYVEETELKNFIIYEKKFENFNENMQCYLNDKLLKKKIKLSKFKTLIKKVKYSQLQFLINYSNELTEDWDIVVISDNSKEFNLVRTYDDNKIFFYLCKDDQPNSIQKEDNEYLKIIMYLSSNRSSYENGMNLINSIRNDKENILSLHVTLICDRFYLENNFLMENKMKKYIKILYQIVDDVYLIAKNLSNDESSELKEYFNYDVYIADSFINVVNFHQYNLEKDINYCNLINEFLSILSSCIELILYILKNKDIYIPRFIYMIRIFEDYYSFEYKQSNIFIKKIKLFNSVFSLNIKYSTPLFCILSKKAKTDYTQNNDNFYDVFLRLFLNLNKVVDNQDTLNQVFFQKIHKNIFYEYYDSFIPIAFSYESYLLFCDIFLSNKYLEISHNDLFDKCYIIPFEYKINKEKLLKISLLTQLTKKLILLNFNFPVGYTFNKRKYTYFSFHKVDFLLDEIVNDNIKKYKSNEIKILGYIGKYLDNKKINKENKNKIIKNIMTFRKNDKFEIYFFETNEFENIIDNYTKEKMKIQTQKVEMRVFQLTEDAKNNQQKSKKRKNNDCKII